MAYDDSSKTRQGGLDDTATNCEKLGRMYQTDHRNDGINFFSSKLNPVCNAFSVPEAILEGTRRITMARKSMHRLKQARGMMKELSISGTLSQVYTNHCIRTIAITLWSDAGSSNRHITTLPCLRNENSLLATTLLHCRSSPRCVLLFSHLP